MVPQTPLPSGELVPVLGLGTWKMGEQASRRAAEIAALRRGIELGMTLVDTAEMYGEGRTEELLGAALPGLRERVFLVSKVYPHNASRLGVEAACERSLRRLRTDRLDLYLLHWRGSIPLAETVEGFERLRAAGKIRHWGVSNFDIDDMEELDEAANSGSCAANQILYNVKRRGPEWELLPWLAARRIPAMAYSPIEQGRIPESGVLAEIGRKHGASPHQIALAWLLRQPNLIAIPKAGTLDHIEQNRRALDVTLEAADLAAIDGAFRPPSRKQPLEML